MTHAITLHTRHVPTILAALRGARERKASVLSYADRADAPPRMLTDGERKMLQIDIVDLDDAIAAVEVARSDGPAN